MAYAHHRLIELWQKCPLDTPPFVLADDRAEIPSKTFSTYPSLDDYISSPTFGQKNDTSLHVGLLPVPYVGNLQKASVFILMLNPGISPGDYFAEQKVEQFRETYVRNLRQENTNDDFPFLFLDPRFAWHPGFEYWQGKFDNIAQELANKKKIPYGEALKLLAHNLACLELIPYHSKSFGASSLLKRLPSARAMLEYVHEILIPKAQSNDAIIIATRSGQNWNLPKHKNIVVYEGGETRSAHLTLKSRGGKVIAKHLGL
jgi:hypothetical protein